MTSWQAYAYTSSQTNNGHTERGNKACLHFGCSWSEPHPSFSSILNLCHFWRGQSGTSNSEELCSNFLTNFAHRLASSLGRPHSLHRRGPSEPCWVFHISHSCFSVSKRNGVLHSLHGLYLMKGKTSPMVRGSCIWAGQVGWPAGTDNTISATLLRSFCHIDNISLNIRIKWVESVLRCLAFLTSSNIASAAAGQGEGSIHRFLSGMLATWSRLCWFQIFLPDYYGLEWTNLVAVRITTLQWSKT